MKKITPILLIFFVACIGTVYGQKIKTFDESSVFRTNQTIDFSQLLNNRMVACDGNLAEYQNTTASGNGGPSQNFEPANAAFSSLMADDFLVPGTNPAIICEIDIIGTGSGLPLDPSHVVILKIYENAAGLPGTEIFSESFQGSVVDPGGTGSFTLSPTDAPLLTGGSTYWVSVQVDMAFAPAVQVVTLFGESSLKIKVD